MQLSRYGIFLVCFAAFICILLYQSEMNFQTQLVPTRSRSRVEVPDNHQNRSKSRHMMRWHRISDKTLVWHMTHYEHRDFPYGGPAIILMLFHYHKETLPSIVLKVCSDDYCECLQRPQWISFGKVIKVRLEVDYLFYAVFTSNSSIFKFNTRSLYDSNCTGSPLIQDLPMYYKTDEKQIEFAVCLYKGIIAKDTSLLDIASWIEINRAIGVEHITMYNQDIGPNITKLLSSYQDEGFVSLIDWKIHNPEKRIANNGQVATTNDCFYRYLRRAKYILFIDLDELIIPHAAVTLGDMMRSAPLNQTKGVTQYRFYNSFWHKTPDIALSESKAYRKLPIHFIRANRTKNIMAPPITRYKNMIKTETAVRIGIHHVYAMKKGQRFIPVPERIGLMHHYRTPDYARNEEQITDKIMSRYCDSVMNQLTNRLPDQVSPKSYK